MSFNSLLINVATIRRYTTGAADSYGVPVRTWGDHIVGQPCRISYPRGRQVQRGTEVVPVDALLFMAVVDVTERDRVIVDTVTYEILFVAELQNGTTEHHLEISLARVKA